jgi:hypothetical protein
MHLNKISLRSILSGGVNLKALPRFAFKAEEYATPNYTGMKLTA